MNRKFVKIAVSTTLSVGIAVSGTGYSGSALAQVAGMGWSTDDRETVLHPIVEDTNSQTFFIASLLSGKVYNSETTGIAVMGTDSSNGTWEYYNTVTGYWYNIEKVDGGMAYILLSSSDQIRFKPNPNWHGKASIDYKLWDTTQGYNSFDKNIDTSGNSAFSAEQGSTSISVTPVNDEPYLTEADGGEYLNLNGNGKYVALPSSINSIYADSFTVEGYLKVDQFNTWMRFFESSNGPGSDNIFVGFDNGKMNFSAYNGSNGPGIGAVNNITTTEIFPQNQWVHVALVYSQYEKKAYIYWDGELKASGTADLSSIGGRLRHNHWLGKSGWGQDGYYYGGMKDVSFWSKAKSREEIISGMNAKLTGWEPGLVAHYKLEQGSPHAISTPPGKDGTIVNATHKQAEGFVGAVTTDLNRSVTRAFKVTDVDGDSLTVTVSSSNPSIVPNENVVIEGTGEERTMIITPLPDQYGRTTLTITVNDGTVQRSYDLNVIINNTITVTNVVLNKDSLDFIVGGDAETLVASVSPENASNKDIMWTSDNHSVATVDSNGVVTPVGPGTAVITVTTVNGWHTDTATVNVADKPGTPENVTAIPGDGEATVNFTAPADNGGSPITNYTVTAQPGGITASGTGSPIKVTGLDNGTAYTFTVVATNRAGDSLSSMSSASVTPIPPAPGAPTLLEPVAGNGEVTLTWNGVDEATGYKVFMSESPDAIDNEVATVTDSVYSHTITGLTNGKAYYFVLKATNTGSDSAPSLPVTATPMTVPGVPTNITATSGNRQAIITFTPPVDDGGSPITGYEVTVMPGNHKVYGTTSPITVTGLDNGTSYTFTVTAINDKGSSEHSLESEPVTPLVPVAPPSEDETNIPAPAPTPVPAPAPQKEAEILVNGKAEDVGTVSTSEQNGQSVTKVALDDQKLNDKLAGEDSSSVLSITANKESDVLIGELTGQTVKNLEKMETKLEIKTANAAYILPADAIRVDEISKQFGAVALQDIRIEVKVAATNREMLKVIESAAVNGKFTLITPAVDFSVSATYGNQNVEISEFNQFVTRMIAIPDGVDVSKITTGVIVDADGSVRHVPTKVTQLNSKYYALINSLTSGHSYSVIWNPIEFSDVEGHWAQAAVNNMGSRMVVDGVGSGLFNPDQNITRAEFAAIVVRGLGLGRDNLPSSFTDVAMSDWYNSAVITAAEFGLIQGFGDGTFRPNEQITREQAMVIIAKAMELTELNSTLPADTSLLDTFVDAPDASKWASMSIAKSVQAGVINGRSETKLAPKANMTRAEVAAIVERLLQNSELI